MEDLRAKLKNQETADEDVHYESYILVERSSHIGCVAVGVCAAMHDDKDLSHRRSAYRASWGWSCQV